MAVKITVELQPFTLPNFVREKESPRPRQDEFRESRCHALHDLDTSVLANLCDEFRAGIFAKAMKKDPAQPKDGE